MSPLSPPRRQRRPDWSPLAAPTHSDLWQMDCCAVVLPPARGKTPPYAASFSRAVRRERRVRRARRLRLLCGVLSALLLTWACTALIAAAAWGALQFRESQAAAVCFLAAAGLLVAGLIQFNHKEHKKSTGPDN